MQLMNPAALAWAAVALPVVLFYFLRVTLRRQPVSSLMFWDQVLHQAKAQSLWQRLRHWISLLLQLLLIGLLVWGLLDPVWTGQAMQPRKVVVVLDQSASMRVSEEGGARIELARRYVQEIIGTLRFRDQLAVIAAGDEPRVVASFVNHRRTLRQALAEIEPRDVTTRWPAAIELAQQMIGDDESGEIILVSDGQDPELETLKRDKRVELHVVGTPHDNLAITTYQIRRSLVDPIGFEVLVEVNNYAQEAVNAQLELVMIPPTKADQIEPRALPLAVEGSQLMDVIPLKLEAGGSWREVLQYTTTDGGILVAQIARRDAFPTDNLAAAVLTSRSSPRVLLLGSPNVYLQSVFESMPWVEWQAVEQLPDELPANVLVVSTQTPPDEIRAGKFLVIDPDRSSELWERKQQEEGGLALPAESGNRLLTHVQLENVWMPRVPCIELVSGWNVLVRSADQWPIIATFRDSQRQVLLLAVGLDESDFPLRTAFPILMSNALNWFEGETGEWVAAVSGGEEFSLELEREAVPDKDGDGVAELVAPDQSSRSIASEGSSVRLRLDQVGVWRWKYGDDVRLLACNLGHKSESLLTTQVQPTLAPTSRLSLWQGIPLWFLFTGLGVVFLLLEWVAYQRRWIS